MDGYGLGSSFGSSQTHTTLTDVTAHTAMQLAGR
jgi:hypothetical protein